MGNSLEVHAHYLTNESDFDLTTCEVKILGTNLRFNMINDSTNSEFITTITPYTMIPDGEVIYEFTLEHPSIGLFGQYTNNVTVRQNLNNYMMSNMVTDSTAGITIIYDVPTVRKDYYDNIDQKLFELYLIQKLLIGVIQNHILLL